MGIGEQFEFERTGNIVSERKIEEVDDFKQGEQVAYIPDKANNNINHENCLFGTIVREKSKGVFWVRFYKDGIPQNIQLVLSKYLEKHKWM